MRITTKFKKMLFKYNITLSITEHEIIVLTLIDKENGEDQQFRGNTFSEIANSAYRLFELSLELY